MKFLKLTRKSDGALVLINPAHVKAVYPYYGKATTVVDYGGTEDGYVEVTETLKEIEAALAEKKVPNEKNCDNCRYWKKPAMQIPCVGCVNYEFWVAKE